MVLPPKNGRFSGPDCHPHLHRSTIFIDVVASLIDLIAPPFGRDANGEVAWINEAGEVVGIAGLPIPVPRDAPPAQVQQAFLWRKGHMTDLGTVAATPNSQASFVNSKRQIVGLSFACDFSVFDAIPWRTDRWRT